MNVFRQLLLVALVAITAPAVALGEGQINVNKASVDELAQILDGVGSARAEAIVAYRTQYGDFINLEEMLAVSGIGEAVIETNRDRIVFSD